jgi:ABC-type multidrug transport system fused ATPase/permease subunit
LAAIPQVVTVFLAARTGRLVFRFATEARQAASRVNSHLREQLQAERVLRVFGREKDERERLGKLSRQQLAANLRLAVLQGGLMPFYAVLSSLGIVLVISSGGALVTGGQWSVGTFTAYLTLFSAMTARTMMAARVLNNLHAGKASWVRVSAKTGAPQADPLDSGQPSGQANDEGQGGLDIEVKDLRFSFPGAPAAALSAVSFRVRPGPFLAVTGPIGSGKSALATVLTGLYPYQGSVLFSGRELRDIPQAERERAISLLDQNAFLFSATIRENVAFFSESDEGRLAETLRLAGLTEDLSAFANGVDTVIGEQGTRVSGGQRQRIALARALYRGSPLVILDDPFSAVDIATEQRMVQRIREAAAGSTLVLFSHRLSSFPQADKVIVLSGGAVNDAGTHEELLANDGLYARIFRAQEWLSAYGEAGGKEAVGRG